MIRLIHVIVEFFKEFISLVKFRLSNDLSEQTEPTTTKEAANSDVEEFEKAVIDGDIDDVMRIYERLRIASLGAITTTVRANGDRTCGGDSGGS